MPEIVADPESATAAGRGASARARRWIAAAVTYGVAYEVARRVPGTASARAFVEDAGLLPLLALVAALAWRTSRRVPAHSHERRGWVLLALAFVVEAVSHAARLVDEDAGSTFGAWPHTFFLLQYPLLLGALTTFGLGLREPAEGRRLLLDTLTTVTSGVVLVAH